MRPRVILLNRTSPSHPGCQLTCDRLLHLINKFGRLVASYPTPGTGPDNQQQVDLSQADVLLINGEGTMHHHRPAEPRHSAAELHRQARLAADKGLRVALVNTVFESFEADMGVYDYVSVRESRSHREALQVYPKAKLAADICFHHLVRDARPRRSGPVVVTDSVFHDFSKELKAWARKRGHVYMPFRKRSPAEALKLLSQASVVVAARYHGAVFALMTRTPMWCLRSNTHKLEGLVDDFNIPGALVSGIEELDKLLSPSSGQRTLPPTSPRDLAAIPALLENTIRQAILGDGPMETPAPISEETQGWPRLRKNVRRLILPRSRHHMAPLPPGFLRPMANHPGCSEIRWDRQRVGVVRQEQSLKGTCQGDGFIVASGPSVAAVDLSFLKGRTSVTVNGGIVKFIEAGLSPTHYMVIDGDFVRHRFDLLRQALHGGAGCHFSAELLHLICRMDARVLGGANLYLADAVNHRYGQPSLPPHQLRAALEADPAIRLDPQDESQPPAIGFSTDASRGLFFSKTVIYPAIQLACHLGLRRLFLLGMDLGGSQPQPRFYEQARDARPMHLDDHYQDHILPCMKLLGDLCRQGELEVYNVSPTSRLPAEVLPKLMFDQMLGMI